MNAPLSLYIHIPYCRTKCVYCDFNSYATTQTPWEEYLEALLSELAVYRNHAFWGRPLQTIFFGGGTPSLFPPEFFSRILRHVSQAFPIQAECEITIECNPGTTSRSSLTGYIDSGINRISFGVQSLRADNLRMLTRIHGPEEAIQAVQQAHEANFKNISIDLMFGVPGQTPEEWQEELKEALELPLRHISVYNLTPEEGTALAKQVTKKRVVLPDEEILLRMYDATRVILREHGFSPYEISNYARTDGSFGGPCRHNLVYWTGEDYLGIGAGAHSYSREGLIPTPDGTPSYRVPASTRSCGARWSTHRQLTPYYQSCSLGLIPLAFSEALTIQEAAAETIMLAMRLTEGLDVADFEKRFGPSARQGLERSAQPFLQRGTLHRVQHRLALTDAGTTLADAIIRTLSVTVDDALNERIVV